MSTVRTSVAHVYCLRLSGAPAPGACVGRNVLLVIDTLIAAMVLPMIVEDVHARGEISRGLESEDPATATVVTQAYLVCCMLCFFTSVGHIGCIGTLYCTTAYLTDYINLLWFFTAFHKTIAALNVSLAALLAPWDPSHPCTPDL